jgi:hypothetical protein
VNNDVLHVGYGYDHDILHIDDYEHLHNDCDYDVLHDGCDHGDDHDVLHNDVVDHDMWERLD